MGDRQVGKVCLIIMTILIINYEHDHLDDNSEVLIVQMFPRLQYCNDQFHWSGPGLHVSEHKRYHPSFMIIITIDILMMVPHFVIIIVLYVVLLIGGRVCQYQSSPTPRHQVRYHYYLPSTSSLSSSPAPSVSSPSVSSS